MSLHLSQQNLADLLQFIADMDMLRTGLFAFAALDAFIRTIFPMPPDQPILLIDSHLLGRIERQIVHRCEGT